MLAPFIEPPNTLEDKKGSAFSEKLKVEIKEND